MVIPITNSSSKIAINFDLIVKECKAVFGGSRSKAYRVLKKDLTEHGFIHDQGSGYISNDTLTRVDIIGTLKGLFSRNAWLNQCCKRLRVTKVAEDIFNGEAHGDLMRAVGELALSEKVTRPIKKKSTSKNVADHAPQPPSFTEIAEQNKNYRPPRKPRSSGNDNDKKPPNNGNSGR